MLWRLIIRLFNLRNNRDIYGSARFLTGFARTKLLNKNHDGLIIDGQNRISLERSFQHCCVLAPTGVGKTTRFIIPNVLNLKTSSAVITDPSGEIHKLTSNYLNRVGYKVKVLNIADADKSLKYNPLFRTNSHTEIQKVADILVESAYPGDTANAFWNDGAKSILNICIRCLKGQKKFNHNLTNLQSLLNMLSYDLVSVNKAMARNLDDMTFQSYKAFINQDDKVFHGMLSTAKQALSKLDPNLSKLTATETLNFELLRTNKIALFIIVPEHEVRYYNFIITLLYTQIFNFCMQLPKAKDKYNSTLFLMDEAGHLRLPNFTTLITTLRKRKVSVSYILQDIEQLTNAYGKAEASAIFNGGFTSKIYMPGLSLQTCEEVSRMLGKRTLSYREMGFHQRKANIIPNRDRDIGRSLLTPDEIRTLPNNEAIFIHGNILPVLLKTVPWFKNRSLIKKTRM